VTKSGGFEGYDEELSELKESHNGVFKGYDEKHN
jgi:hypothetical protein